MAARLIPRGLAALLLAVVVVPGVTACGIGVSGTGGATPVPASVRPSTGTTAAVAETRREIAAAIGARSLQLDDPQVPFRPPESPRLAAAPRAVYQVLLPGDSMHGFISVYEFPDPATAASAGNEQAAYIASGPGRVQFAPDTRYVIRQVGTTIVFFSWSPSSSPDPRTAEIQQALETLGTGIAVPR